MDMPCKAGNRVPKRRHAFSGAIGIDIRCVGFPWASLLGYWRLHNNFEGVLIY